MLQLINKFKKCRDFDSESFNRAQNLFSSLLSYKMTSKDSQQLRTSYSIISQLLEASLSSEITGEKAEIFVAEFSKNSIFHLCPQLSHVNTMIKTIEDSNRPSSIAPTLFEVLNFAFEECPETFVQEAGLKGFVNLFKSGTNPDALNMVKSYI